MHISLAWLREYVDIPKEVTPEQIQRDLTLHSFEIERITRQGEMFDRMVVGIIREVKPHANADKLRVCSVDAGENTLQIVCGGSNLAVGQRVALALSGSRVKWHGEGELITLTDTEIRGVKSEGMICAASEIGRATGQEAEKEIMDLSSLKVPAGTPLAEAFGMNDTFIEVDNKAITNRPDCWGHIGVARELGAILGRKMHVPETPEVEVNKKEIALHAKIEASDVCRRWVGVAMNNIKVGPSPEWMARRLESVGVRPINVIVDCTNYVMYEMGQPMHAFDARAIQDSRIIVRKSRVDEKCVTLDGVERTLPAGIGVIADKKHVLALAGIMGCKDSMVVEDTTQIIIEAAWFDPLVTRKAATALDLRTDASARFEKTLDPTMPSRAIARVVQLILELVPGSTVASSVVDEGSSWKKSMLTKPLELHMAFLRERMGVEIPMARVGSILQSLGFVLKKTKKTGFVVVVPSWRATKDISIEEDLIEEVARMYGYDQIPEQYPRMSIAPAPRNGEREAMMRVREALALGRAFTETQTYSFTSLETLQKMDLDPSAHIAVANPLSREQTHLRRSLLPNMLVQVSQELRSSERVMRFEIGKNFRAELQGEQTRLHSGEYLPQQHVFVTGVVAMRGDSVPFTAARDAAVHVLQTLGVDVTLRGTEQLTNWMHPGRSVSIRVGDVVVGEVSELHPRYMDRLGLRDRVGFFEIGITALVPHITAQSKYHPLPLYPSVKRDLAIVVPEHVHYEHVTRVMREADPLLTYVEGFDVYRGEHVQTHHKSLAFHLEFMDVTRTLTSAEVDAALARITQALARECDAVIRA